MKQRWIDSLKIVVLVGRGGALFKCIHILLIVVAGHCCEKRESREREKLIEVVAESFDKDNW